MNAKNITPGQSIRFKLEGEMVTGKFISDYQNRGTTALVEYKGRKLGRVYDKVWPAETSAQTSPVFHFNVNERFDFISRLVDMVVRGHAKSLVVTGSGGLGKSHTVFNRMKSHDLGEGDYDKITGHMTPKALYRQLWEAGCKDNNKKIVVFDDCNSVIGNEVSANLLKAALDSYGERKLCWCSEMGFGNGEDELPKSFKFSGSVIFISNYSLGDFPQPLISRSMYVDVTMTAQEKIDRIRNIAPALCPNLPASDRDECLGLLDELKEHIADLNLRTMMKVASIRKAQPDCWRDISTYIITAKL